MTEKSDKPKDKPKGIEVNVDYFIESMNQTFEVAKNTKDIFYQKKLLATANTMEKKLADYRRKKKKN